jgi:hypothetical protein
VFGNIERRVTLQCPRYKNVGILFCKIEVMKAIGLCELKGEVSSVLST